MKDLFVLVADLDIEVTMKGLLTKRQPSLGIRDIDPTFIRHMHRDPGCRRGAAETARKFVNDHKYALVLFDKHGSGDEQARRQDIQSAVEKDLRQAGWENRSKAIVIEPELEMWVWSGSSHVGKALGWDEGTDALRKWLCENNLWPGDEGKPPDPKLAMKRAMEVKKHSPRPEVFRNLAEGVSLTNCKDSAFLELCKTLQEWFPASGGF